MTFRPERYITTLTHDAISIWTFGCGCGVCPGRYVADNALLATIAQSLAVFNIEKPIENGKTGGSENRVRACCGKPAVALPGEYQAED
jgi:hypothetical protein